MRTNFFLVIITILYFSQSAVAQESSATNQSESTFFNLKYWEGVATKRQLSPADKAEFLAAKKREFEALQHEHRIFADSELVWVEQPTGKKLGGASTFTGPCTNIDFESGNLSGWVRSTGFHPLYNATGCCPTANGAQAIMSGTGLDPYGGFPVVFPGGNFSLRLGNNALQGVADRLEQSFLVTPANANFTYRYAVVLNDQGHPVSQQPAFTIEMIDTTGFQVPCTMYTVAAASNISGFLTSSVTGGSPNAPVVYKPWTSVAIDLTPSMGKVVTIRFTTYDCSQGGHFGYAYIDGSCQNFQTDIADTTCPDVPFNMCGPDGFDSYFWTGPNSYTNNVQCIQVADPGVYSCQTILSAGCPGPTFNHTLTLRPKPVVSFTPVTTGACALQYTFNSTSSIAGGLINSYAWDFGDNTGTFLQSPGHTFPTAGTYSVEFKAVSDHGCSDSVMQAITVYPLPNLSFSPPSNCINTVVQFTNTSTIAVGTINSYTWNLGNGVNSNLVNPANSYSVSGPYSVTLAATSDQGCTSVLSGTLGIFPPPVVTFTAANFCLGDATAFTTSTSIASGTLVSYNWDLGDGTSSAVIAPVHTYTNSGPYLVSFSATSNHNCVSYDSHLITIHSLPTPSFTATDVCLGGITTFSNVSQIAYPYTISSYSWNFGSGVTSTATNPANTYTNWGAHNVTLTATSDMGCRTSVTDSLLVHPLPNLSFSPPSACVNTAIQFTNTSTVPAPYSITSYSWNFGNGNTTTSVNPIYSYTLGNTYTIELTAGTNEGCAITRTTSLDIWPEPVALFSTSNSCQGTATTFTNSSYIPAPDNIPFFAWDFGNGATSALPNPVFSYSTSGVFTVQLTATSNHGCTDSYSVPVTAYPIPLVSVSASSVCPNVATNFISSFTLNPTSLVSYTWNYGDGTPPSFGLNPTHTYTVDNSYLVQLSATTSEGCVGSGTTIALVHPAPVVAFNPPGACVNSAINFTNTSTVASGSIVSYLWDFGNGNNSTVSNPVFAYTSPGTFVIVLTATSDQGCSTTGNLNLPIYPVPSAPDFTYNPVQCLGNPTTFTAQAGIAPGGTIDYYNWDFGNGFYAAIQNPSHTYNVIGSYPVTFSATSNHGCIAAITKTLAIHPLPAISFSATSVCLGAATNFTNYSSISGPTVNTIQNWSWNYGDGTSPDPNQSPLPHTYTAHGTHTVVLSGTTNMGCVNSHTAATVVNALPNIVFSPPSACVGTAIQFTNSTSIALGSISSYSWNFGNGGSSTLKDPVFTYNTDGNKQITLTALSNAGCTSSATNPLSIYPFPGVTVTPVSNGCTGSPVSFLPNYAYTGPIGTGITSYTWDFGNNQYSVTNTSTVGLTNHAYPTYGTYTVHLSAVTVGNCKTTDSAVVTVFPRPNPSFVSQNYCFSDSASFINTSSIPAGQITSHLWYFGDGIATATQKDPKHKFSSPGTFTVVLSETSNPQPGLACTNTVASLVTINPLPQPSFTVASVCFGESTKFKNTSVIAGITGWSWDFNNNGQNNTAAFDALHTYTTPGVYTVNLSAVNNFSCVSVFSNTVQVYTNPTASFTANSVCYEQQTAFTNLSTTGDASSFSSHVWNFGGKDSSILSSPQYSFSSPGVHTVELRVQTPLGCKSMYSSSVTVHHLPVANFSNNSVCQGGLTEFANFSYIADGSFLHYRWDYMSDGWDDSSSTTAITPFSYPGSGGYLFKLQAVSDKGCSHFKTGVVLVHSNPIAAFANSKICAGDRIVFTSLSTSSDGSITAHLWDFNGDNVTDQNDPEPSFTYSLSGDYETRHTVTTQYGCSDSKSRMMYVNPKAVPAYRIDKTEGCPPLCVKLEDLSSISNGTFSTNWNFGDLTPVNNIKDPSHCFNPGIYDLTMELISDSGCVTVLEHPAFVKVYDNPVAGFEIIPGEIDEDEPNITVETRSDDAYSTRYFINDGTIFKTENFTHNLKNLDGKTRPMIVQIVENEMGCSDTTFQLVKIKPAFSLYVPDAFTPNGDGVNDQFYAKGVGIVEFRMLIFDRWGHIVFSADDLQQKWDGRSKGSLESVKQDVYTWKAEVIDIHRKKHDLVGRVMLLN